MVDLDVDEEKAGGNRQQQLNQQGAYGNHYYDPQQQPYYGGGGGSSRCCGCTCTVERLICVRMIVSFGLVAILLIGVIVVSIVFFNKTHVEVKE